MDTNTTERVYQAIVSLISRNNYPPTLREIGDETDISSVSVVSYHLLLLERAGRITRQNGKARTIQIVKGGGRNV